MFYEEDKTSMHFFILKSSLQSGKTSVIVDLMRTEGIEAKLLRCINFSLVKNVASFMRLSGSYSVIKFLLEVMPFIFQHCR